MSIPRRDPNFTTAELTRDADNFIAAGKRYWEAVHRAGLTGGAVVWITKEPYGTAIFTRTEYRHVLLQNIPNVGPVTMLGATADEK